MRADDFRELLKRKIDELREAGRGCVILKLVDMFDFEGSFVRDFAVSC